MKAIPRATTDPTPATARLAAPVNDGRLPVVVLEPLPGIVPVPVEDAEDEAGAADEVADTVADEAAAEDDSVEEVVTASELELDMVDDGAADEELLEERAAQAAFAAVKTASGSGQALRTQAVAAA